MDHLEESFTIGVDVATIDAPGQPGYPRLLTQVVVGREPLSELDVVAVARQQVRVLVPDDVLAKVGRARHVIERIADGQTPVYGVGTGFGALNTVQIPVAQRDRLQRALILSHAAGVGPEVEREVIRAMMLMRLRTLTSGRTGVSPQIVQAYASLLNSGITPVVHEYGSLGCSGDLAPLSAVAMTLIGEGTVTDPHGRRCSAADALREAGLAPVHLGAKEGLALINGTDGMLGMLLLAVHDLRALLRTADVAAAISVEAQLGTDSAFAAEVMALRPHRGQAESAANLRALVDGSGVMASHRGPECMLVQDAYSLRCTPQVHGAARDTLRHAEEVAQIEVSASIDNPVLVGDDVVSNGNFHGAPLAQVLDFLAISVADVANISERRIDRFCDPARSRGLPAFLADDPGIDSGLMIAQYTAAGIVSELKRLAAPASVDSIPSSAMQEDHVSMGWHAARKLRRAIEGLSDVLAIELVAGVRALHLRAPLRPSSATAAVLATLDAAGAGRPGPDRHLAPELAAAGELVRNGAVVQAAESVTGPLA
jgi:histidine ammonia-lyase